VACLRGLLDVIALGQHSVPSAVPVALRDFYLVSPHYKNRVVLFFNGFSDLKYKNISSEISTNIF
jgi:hypothetical protein